MKRDWRITNQEKFLKGLDLKKVRYKKHSESWDHEHCKFCFKKIMEDCFGIDYCVNEAYCTLDERKWICEDCYLDFKEMFKWNLIK